MINEQIDWRDRTQKVIASNRKARFEYEIVQVIQCGIELLGTEVKALRMNKCNLTDSYAIFKNKNSFELQLINTYIGEYDFGNRENHIPKRVRRLLLHRSELIKLKNQTSEKGYSLIPLSLVFSGPFVKVELAIAKPKKKYDKREATKEREVKREINRRMKDD